MTIAFTGSSPRTSSDSDGTSEEKRSQLSRDLARHHHGEGAYMELGSKLIELIAQAPQIFERADPEQRRELVGLLTSNRVLKGRTLEFELRKPFDALVSAANSEMDPICSNIS